MVETLRSQLSDNAINYKVDDSGASVGKRYARNDELGIPLAITVDYASVGQAENEDEKGLVGTVTIRERDSQSQIRVPAGEAVDVIVKMTTRGMKWGEAQAMYTSGAKGAAGSTQAEVEAYLSKHKISEILNQCLNETLAAKPENPLKHLSTLLAATGAK